MGRFRVIKSKGQFYVVTADATVAGPFADQAEALQRSDRLTVRDAQAAAAGAKPVARTMNITPGYRSPDVEDGRFDGPIPATFLPPEMQRWVKWYGVPRGELPPPPGGKSPAAKHHFPIDPNERVENWGMTQFGEWVRSPSTQTWGEMMAGKEPKPPERKP